MTPKPTPIESREAREIQAAYEAGCPNDFMLFVQGLIIPSGSGPQLFSKCMADFQRECFEEIAPSLQAIRNGTLPPIRRFWWERTKKAGKDSDLGACLLWLAAFPKRPLYIQVGAADKEQADIVRRRIKDLLYYNSWLKKRVELQRGKIKGGELVEVDILAADIGGSHGGTPDLLICNELSHVLKWEFIENLLDNADGVPRGVVITATNAGVKGSKAEVLRNNAIASSRTAVRIYTKIAPWIDSEDVADAKKRNSTSRQDRLWRGLWVSGAGDALSDEDVDGCFVLRKDEKERGEILKPLPDWDYIGGLDLGVNNDHSGLMILGVHKKERRIRVVRFKAWAPIKITSKIKMEVDLIDVEQTCFEWAKLYKIRWFGYDDWQAKFMAQVLRRRGIPMREVNFSSMVRTTEMAEALILAMKSHILECYDDIKGTLRRDLGKFRIVEKGEFSYKLEAVRDEYGHADVGTALVICLPRAVMILDRTLGLQPDDDIGEVEGEDPNLTDAEMAEMPDELRELCEEDYSKDGYEEDGNFPLEDW